MLDLAVALQPIPGDQPAGIDLRMAQMNDHPLDRVKKDRHQENPLLLPPGTEPRKVNWQAVFDGCRAVLTRHSKDLEAAAYLVEAQTRLSGLAGLARGLEIVGGLIETFWAVVHPGAPSRDNPEPMPELRAKWVNWIGSSNDLRDALRSVGLGFAGEGGRQVAFGDLLDARRVARAYQENPTEYERLIAAQLTTPEQWAAAVGSSSAAQRDSVAAGVDACLAKLGELEAKCGAAFPPGDAPSVGKLRDVLETLGQEMRQPAGAAAGAGDVLGTAAGGTGMAAASAGGGAAVAAPGSIQTRDDAVRTLQAVARFLRQTEPHSPVSYMLERCTRWLSMGFDELMQDLMKDPGILDTLREKLGIKPPAEG
jgi:type VI secretion system protein ImpA